MSTSDLESALAAYAPTVRPPRLEDTDVSYALHDTVVGTLVLAVDLAGRAVACSYDAEDAVCARLAAGLSPRVLRRPARLDLIRRQLDEYLAGARRSFEVAVDLRLATPFARLVLDRLDTVPYGSTAGYGELAAGVGRPSAARAVGTALGSNPVCILVPCHRIVPAGGGVGGYAGGSEAKAALLALEAHPPR